MSASGRRELTICSAQTALGERVARTFNREFVFRLQEITLPSALPLTTTHYCEEAAIVAESLQSEVYFN